ncbi:MAG: DUF1302 domain-containing protein [Oceanospirillales bacterium]|nr:DUF1302 domain-containing protein [Oceanospirillales bacterium]
MSKTIITTSTQLAIATSTLLAGVLTSVSASAGDTTWAGFVENATYHRKDVGISKFRNTAQAEFETKFDSDSFRSLRLNGVLRGTYDGVYDLNDGEFGKDAQQPYLGADWHSSDLSSPTILSAGVPFPCDNDPTLCGNLDGYMDQDESDAKFPDFNDRLDFIRELYLSADKELSNGDVLSFRLGKQQVVWGKTDLFRVLDVINPVDYSRHNIYDELEDIRIPQWMLKVDWRMGPNQVLDDSNLSLVWNFDKFRPSNLGTCGQPYRILDAGCFFSSSIAGVIPIIHDVEEPEWSLANTQLGLKWEGVYGDATFSVNALTYRQQLPSLHWRGPDVATPALDGVFDIKFPRVNLLGGAIDYYSMDMDAVWRMELAYTQGEELPRDAWGHQEADMLRYVIGLDKNLVIPQLGTSSAFLISAQLFGEHILDHEADMPNDEDNWIATGLFKGWYMNNRLSPQIILAHDFAGKATAVAPSVSWTPDNNWMFNLGLNVKFGGNEKFYWSAAGQDVWEPLARFTNGPIGVANQEDEIQFTVRYSF